jgi:hypothetical protein
MKRHQRRSAAGVGWMAISHTSDENSSRCTASSNGFN